MEHRIKINSPLPAGLYKRVTVKEAVPAQEAVEYKPAVYNSLNQVSIPATEAKPAVEAQPAEYRYEPYRPEPVTFEFDLDPADYDSGGSAFERWLTYEGGNDLSSAFNIEVERKQTGFSGTMQTTYSFTISAQEAIDKNLTDEDDVKDYIHDNGHFDLENKDEDDTTVETVYEDDDEWVEVEW